MNPSHITYSRREEFGLTTREHEIVALVSVGYTHQDLAARLGISENMARIDLANILDKLGVSNCVELVLFAAHEGLTEES